MKNQFQYKVFYPRTNNWWSEDWRQLSNWCNNTIGICAKDWEYINERFMFTSKQDMLMFLLRWGNASSK